MGHASAPAVSGFAAEARDRSARVARCKRRSVSAAVRHSSRKAAFHGALDEERDELAHPSGAVRRHRVAHERIDALPIVTFLDELLAEVDRPCVGLPWVRTAARLRRLILRGEQSRRVVEGRLRRHVVVRRSINGVARNAGEFRANNFPSCSSSRVHVHRARSAADCGPDTRAYVMTPVVAALSIAGASEESNSKGVTMIVNNPFRQGSWTRAQIDDVSSGWWVLLVTGDHQRRGRRHHSVRRLDGERSRRLRRCAAVVPRRLHDVQRPGRRRGARLVGSARAARGRARSRGLGLARTDTDRPRCVHRLLRAVQRHHDDRRLDRRAATSFPTGASCWRSASSRRCSRSGCSPARAHPRRGVLAIGLWSLVYGVMHSCSRSRSSRSWLARTPPPRASTRRLCRHPMAGERVAHRRLRHQLTQSHRGPPPSVHETRRSTPWRCQIS